MAVEYGFAATRSPKKDNAPRLLGRLAIGRRSIKHRSAISQSNLAGARHLGTVLRQITFHSNLIASLQGILSPSLPAQLQRAAELEIPIRPPAGLVLHID